MKYFKVAAINAELFPAVAIKYHIVSYPTLKLFSDKYDGKDLTTNSTKLKVLKFFSFANLFLKRMKYFNIFPLNTMNYEKEILLI